MQLWLPSLELDQPRVVRADFGSQLLSESIARRRTAWHAEF